MAKDNETTLKFNADISGLKKGIADANRQIKIANSAFKAAASGLDNWSDSADGLTAKISQLEAVQDAENKKLQMLNRQYELTVEQLGETSEEAENLKIKINNQQAAVNKIGSELDNYRDKLESIQSTTEQSVSAYDRLTTEISQQEIELKKLQREYANYVVEGNGASDEARQLAARITELSSDLNANRTALNNADRAADSLSNSMDDAGDATATLSDGFTIVKGALADLVADGIRWCIDSLKELVTESDKAFNSFQAQTGASTEEMAAFQDQISELYKNNFGESMEDVAEAMAKVAQTTKETDPSKIKDLTQNALILRDTFDFEIDESMRAANMLMDQFGMTGEEAFNLIAQGAQNGLNKNGDLLDSINEYSVHYKQLGYTGEEFFNSLVNGAAAGTFSVDKLGDAVKEFGIRVREGGDDVNMWLNNFGLTVSGIDEELIKKHTKNAEELNKINENIAKGGTKSQLESWNERKAILEEEEAAYFDYAKSINEENKKILAEHGDIYERLGAGGEEAKAATAEIVSALFAMEDPIEQNAAGVALFGTMWEDLGADGVKALMDVNGEADATAATMEEINAIKYNDIGSAFSEIGRIIKVDLLQPIADELIPKLTEFVGLLKSDAIPWLIDNGNELVAVITSIGAAFVAFKTVSIIQGIITAFTTLIPIIKSVGVAQAALNLIMSANPIGLIISAIAALVAGFVYLWNTSDEFRNFWIGLWEKIKDVASAAIEGIKSFFTGIWDWIKDNWQGLLMLIVNPFAGAFKLIYDNCEGFRNFIDNLVQTVGQFFADMWASISAAAGEAWAKIKEFFAPAVEWFSALLSSIKDTVSSVINVIVGLAKGCWAIIKRVFEVVGDWFNKNVITPVKKYFTDMWTKISDAAKNAWTFISGVFKSAATWFNETIITPISTFFTTMWDNVKSGAAAAWNGITSVFGIVVDWFREKFSAAWQAVKDVFSTGGKIFDGIKEGIVSAFTTVVNAIIGGINKIITIPFNAINSMLNKIHDISILGIEPFKSLWETDPISTPQIPLLEKGGVLKRGQVGLLEGNGAEAVVPLEKNTEWIKRVAGELSQQFNRQGGANITNGGNTVNNYTFNQTNNSPKALNRLEIYRQSKQQTAFIKAVTSGV